MRFKLRTLFFVTVAVACLLTWAVANGLFSGDVEKRNLEIMNKLELPANMVTSDWTVADLASYLKKEHKIPVFVSAGHVARKLGDQDLSEIRLKNCIRVVLLYSELSFVVRNGRLEILDSDDPAVQIPGIYSQGDLVAPRKSQ